MKIISSFLFVLIVTASQAQHALEKIWESDTTLAIPESALFDKTVINLNK